MRFRIGPKNNYIETASIEGLYALSDLWKSEMLFCRDELLFLRDLLDKHFVWIVQDGKMETVERLSNSIDKKQGEVKTLLGRIEMQLVHLEELMEQTFSHDERVFRQQHAALEEKIHRFLGSYKRLKSSVFEVVRSGLNDEKVRALNPGK